MRISASRMESFRCVSVSAINGILFVLLFTSSSNAGIFNFCFLIEGFIPWMFSKRKSSTLGVIIVLVGTLMVERRSLLRGLFDWLPFSAEFDRTPVRLRDLSEFLPVFYPGLAAFAGALHMWVDCRGLSGLVAALVASFSGA